MRVIFVVVDLVVAFAFYWREFYLQCTLTSIISYVINLPVVFEFLTFFCYFNSPQALISFSSWPQMHVTLWQEENTQLRGFFSKKVFSKLSEHLWNWRRSSNEGKNLGKYKRSIKNNYINDLSWPKLPEIKRTLSGKAEVLLVIKIRNLLGLKAVFRRYFHK